MRSDEVISPDKVPTGRGSSRFLMWCLGDGRGSTESMKSYIGREEINPQCMFLVEAECIEINSNAPHARRRVYIENKSAQEDAARRKCRVIFVL